MNVKELTDQLLKMDPEAEVFMHVMNDDEDLELFHDEFHTTFCVQEYKGNDGTYVQIKGPK